MPSKIPFWKNRPKTISGDHCTSDQHGKDENSEAPQRAVKLPSLRETNNNDDIRKYAWPSNKNEKFPTVKGVDSPTGILDKGSNSVKMLLNWQTYWKTSQSVLVSRKPDLTMGILGIERKTLDSRQPSSMLEISEHAQLIRNRIRMKTDGR